MVIKVVNSTTYTEIGLLKGHKDFVLTLEFSPDGKYIVSGSFDSTIKIWNATTLTLIHTISEHT